MDFTLDSRLEKDCVSLGRLRLCEVLLMNDSQYPWLILVPRRPGVREFIDLSKEDQVAYQIESNLVSKALKMVFNPDKLNIAALGNVVPQLHIHHIARFEKDNAWPDPVWGKHPPKPYEITELEQVLEDLRDKLSPYLKKKVAH